MVCIYHTSNKTMDWLQERITKLKMHEKNLYPMVETFLKTRKNCLSEDVGSELSLKRGKTSLRADVFGVSNQDEQIIYLCEGKKELKRRSFGKVVGDQNALLSSDSSLKQRNNSYFILTHHNELPLEIDS